MWHPLPVWDDVVDARIQYGSTLSRYGSLDNKARAGSSFTGMPTRALRQPTNAGAMESKKRKNIKVHLVLKALVKSR
jgi:hypothetical protein